MICYDYEDIEIELKSNLELLCANAGFRLDSGHILIKAIDLDPYRLMFFVFRDYFLCLFLSNWCKIAIGVQHPASRQSAFLFLFVLATFINCFMIYILSNLSIIKNDC